MAETKDTNNDQFDLGMVLPAFDDVAASISQAAHIDGEPIAPVADGIDWGSQMEQLQKQIENLSQSLEKQSDENPFVPEFTDNLSKKLQHNRIPASLDDINQQLEAQTHETSVELEQMIKQLDEQLHQQAQTAVTPEPKPLTQLKPAPETAAIAQTPAPRDEPTATTPEIHSASQPLPAAITPDFPSNVQNWTDNPFNRDFQVYSGRAADYQPAPAAEQLDNPHQVTSDIPVPPVFAPEPPLPELDKSSNDKPVTLTIPVPATKAPSRLADTTKTLDNVNTHLSAAISQDNLSAPAPSRLREQPQTDKPAVPDFPGLAKSQTRDDHQSPISPGSQTNTVVNEHRVATSTTNPPVSDQHTTVVSKTTTPTVLPTTTNTESSQPARQQEEQKNTAKPEKSPTTKKSFWSLFTRAPKKVNTDQTAPATPETLKSETTKPETASVNTTAQPTATTLPPVHIQRHTSQPTEALKSELPHINTITPQGQTNPSPANLPPEHSQRHVNQPAEQLKPESKKTKSDTAPQVRAPKIQIKQAAVPKQTAENNPTENSAPKAAAITTPVNNTNTANQPKDSKITAVNTPTPKTKESADKATTQSAPEKTKPEKPAKPTKNRDLHASLEELANADDIDFAALDLSAEELQLLQRLRRKKHPAPKSASYGAIVTLVLLFVAVGLSLVAVWVWFGSMEARESAQITPAQPVSTIPTPLLQELLEVPAYTIRYSSVNDSVNMVVELQHRGQSTLTIDKTIGKTFLERAGEFYEIDLVADTAQKLSEPPAEYKRYLILTPQTLGKLQEKGQETFHGQLYQTQKYDNFTGYFGDGSLKLVSRRSDNTEFMIRSFDQTVENGFDLLPGETGPEQSRGQEQSATSSAASSSLQLETVSIRPPADQKTGDVSVGQYIVFD